MDTSENDQELTLDFANGAFKTEDGDAKTNWILSSIRIAEKRAWLKTVVAIVLVSSVVLAFPIYILGLYLLPDLKQEVVTGFAQWITVIASLAGASIGVGAITDRKRTDG